MREQLAAGLALGTVAAVSAGAGLHWLAIAALAASLPFLTAGIGLTLGALRTRHERPASPTH
jgi:hypothetical protein